MAIQSVYRSSPKIHFLLLRNYKLIYAFSKSNFIFIIEGVGGGPPPPPPPPPLLVITSTGGGGGFEISILKLADEVHTKSFIPIAFNYNQRV